MDSQSSKSDKCSEQVDKQLVSGEEKSPSSSSHIPENYKANPPSMNVPTAMSSKEPEQISDANDSAISLFRMHRRIPLVLLEMNKVIYNFIFNDQECLSKQDRRCLQRTIEVLQCILRLDTEERNADDDSE